MKYILVPFFIFISVTSFTQNNLSVSNDTTVSLKVYGICAAQCKPRIETAAKGKGVQSALWNVDTKMISLVYNPSKTTLDKIVKRILDAGHDVENKKAKDIIYKSLPPCCYYRELKSMGSTNAQQDTSAITNKTALSNEEIKGIVLAEDNKGSFKPLQGANVVWLGTNSGTVTNENGAFSIKPNGERLIISYTGFIADTISVTPTKEVKIVLASGNQLKEVKVTSSTRATYINPLDAFRTQNITQKELFKAACCNLSESFETNPSVDVSYNDAVTGSKQIQLLGLA